MELYGLKLQLFCNNRMNALTRMTSGCFLESLLTSYNSRRDTPFFSRSKIDAHVMLISTSRCIWKAEKDREMILKYGFLALQYK